GEALDAIWQTIREPTYVTPVRVHQEDAREVVGLDPQDDERDPGSVRRPGGVAVAERGPGSGEATDVSPVGVHRVDVLTPHEGDPVAVRRPRGLSASPRSALEQPSGM